MSHQRLSTVPVVCLAALLLHATMGFAQESGSLVRAQSLAGHTDTTQEFAWLPRAGRERPIRLAEAVSLALGQNLDARRASVVTRIARQQARESRLAWIPALAGSAGISQTSGRVQGSFGDLRDVEYSSVAPFGRLAIGLNPLETWFGTAAASQRAESAEADEQAVQRLVLIRVAELYHELAREHANVLVARVAAQDARDLQRITGVLLRQGLGRGDDAERARVERANTEQRVIQTEGRLEAASINLAAALDLDPTTRLVPADDVAKELTLVPPDQDLTALLDQALGSRPEVTAARRRLEATERERSAAVARLASPTVEAFVQKGLSGDRFSDLAPLTRYGVAATWSLSASGVERIRAADSRREEARLALEQVQQRIRAEVVQAWTDVQAAGARLDLAREGRGAGESTLRISQVRFRNGTSLAIEVLQAQQALEAARLAEVATLADYNQAQVRLRAQIGPLLPADFLRR